MAKKQTLKVPQNFLLLIWASEAAGGVETEEESVPQAQGWRKGGSVFWRGKQKVSGDCGSSLKAEEYYCELHLCFAFSPLKSFSCGLFAPWMRNGSELKGRLTSASKEKRKAEGRAREDCCVTAGKRSWMDTKSRKAELIMMCSTRAHKLCMSVYPWMDAAGRLNVMPIPLSSSIMDGWWDDNIPGRRDVKEAGHEWTQVCWYRLQAHMCDFFCC